MFNGVGKYFICALFAFSLCCTPSLHLAAFNYWSITTQTDFKCAAVTLICIHAYILPVCSHSSIIMIQWQVHNGNPISWESLANCSQSDSHYLESSKHTHSDMCTQAHLWLVSHWFETLLICRKCSVSAQRFRLTLQVLANSGRRGVFHIMCLVYFSYVDVISSHMPGGSENRFPFTVISQPPLHIARICICRCRRQNSRGRL